MAQVIVARRRPLVVFQRGPSGAAKILAGNDTANAARFADNSQEWAEGTEPGGPGTKSAKEWSEESALSAATAEAASGPTYASTAAGLAATTSGQAFAVDNGDGTVTVYLNSAGVAVAQRTLGTTAYFAATTGASRIGTNTGDTLQARLDQYKLEVKTYNANGLGVIIGDAPYSANAIGAGTILFGGWTAAPNANRLSGTVTNLRCIVGGYDNEIGAALASVIVGSHHSSISTGATHGAIFGGSYNTIPAGNYGTIGGGTGNSVSADSATVAGGTTNTIGAGATGSTIGGGSTNSISASTLRGTIAGGINNQITVGTNSAIVGGNANVVSGGNSVAGGSTNTVSGSSSFAFGLSNTVTGGYAGAWGRSNTVSKDYGAAFGYQAVARSTGRTAAGGQIAAPGDAQFTDVPIKGVTTSNTNVYLTGADGNQFVVPFPTDNFAATVSALLTAVEPATGDSKSFRVDALVKRIGGVNTLVGGGVTTTVIAADAGAAAWTITAFSLSTNNMRIGVAGDVGKTIRWSGKVTAVEVSF